MTTTQLEALLIDQALGELSEEASALLEHHLGLSPDHANLAAEVRDTLGISADAVALRPLVPGSPPAAVRLPKPGRVWLQRAALLAVSGFALGAAYLAGRGSQPSPTGPASIADREDRATPSPWVRYRLGESGQLAVIPASGSRS